MNVLLIANVKWRTSFHTMKIHTSHYGAKSYIKSKSHLFHNFFKTHLKVLFRENASDKNTIQGDF